MLFVWNGTSVTSAIDNRRVEAEIIEFYVPLRYVSKIKYTPLEMRGKILEFKPKDKE